MSLYSSVRTKILAFVVATFLFVSFGVGLFYQQRAATEKAVVSFPATMWALNKIELEYGRFTRALALYKHDAISYDELFIAFEIFWSRVDIALVSDDTRLSRDMVQLIALLDDMKTALVVTELQLEDLPAGRSPVIIEIEQRFLAFKEPLSLVSVEFFSSRSTEFRKALVDSLFDKLAIYLLGLLVSGLMLIALLLREIKESRRNANHDSLTGLANRGYFNKALEAEHLHTRANARALTVMLVDLNDFKLVNDKLGHRAGDELLKIVAVRMKSALAPQDFISRLGGDEFAVIIRRVVSEAAALALARDLMDAISQPVVLTDGSWKPRASIGIGRRDPLVSSAEDLLFDADMAMYAAKQKQVDNVALCDDSLQTRMMRTRRIESDLRLLLSGTLNDDELYVSYQPIVKAKDQSVYAVEALLRWNHPYFGMLSPLEVVEVAETHGLGGELGEWVLRQACDTISQLEERLDVRLMVSVNVAPSMYRERLPDRVQRVLSLTGIDADQLILEVTENTAMSDIGGDISVLHELKALGVTLALDDFGTGLSSLSYLNDLPIDIVKLDRSFVANDTAKNHRDVLNAIMQLAQSYSLEVIAEGIEQYTIVPHLTSGGCDYFQGYYFAKPMLQTQLYRRLEAGELQVNT